MAGLKPVSFKKGRGHAPRLSAPYVPGERHERYWSDVEIQVLKDHYEKDGAAVCLAKLPGRSLLGVYQRAQILGLKSEKITKPRELHTLTPEIEARIREEWPNLEGRGAVNELAEKLGVPRWWLSKTASKLHLAMPHKKEPPWTAAEEALLREAPLHNLDKCAKIFREHGFNRSPTAIAVRAKRLSLSRRATQENFSGTACAKIVGMDNKTFTQLCVTGEVQASRRGTKRLPQQGGDAWDVAPAELRRFIIENLERIDFRKVDKFALVHVLTTATKPEDSR